MPVGISKNSAEVLWSRPANPGILCASCQKGMSMKAKDSVWVLFAVVFLGLGILSGCDTHHQSANTAKPANEAKPLFTPEAASLAQQKMCDEQAAKRFRENEPSGLDSYTSHYDPAVNVCYVRIHSISSKPATIGDVVYDAFGGRVYAKYVWSNPERKQFSEISSIECEINIPGKPAEKCTTFEKFNELTEKYFGVTQ
jgi:hypothetical protein